MALFARCCNTHTIPSFSGLLTVTHDGQKHTCNTRIARMRNWDFCIEFGMRRENGKLTLYLYHEGLNN
jgi:hypothetical protein